MADFFWLADGAVILAATSAARDAAAAELESWCGVGALVVAYAAVSDEEILTAFSSVMDGVMAKRALRAKADDMPMFYTLPKWKACVVL